MNTETTVIHGIRQCDTCRKALAWLKANDVPHQFFDLRLDSLNRAMIEQWLEQLPAEVLLNRRSTTWRQLSEAEKSDDDTASLLLAYPTLIKRPLLSHAGQFSVGFKPQQWATTLGLDH